MLDYLVIGGGSGGIASANRAAEYGAQVGLIEAGPIGGTCVNLGCVPKKLNWSLAHAFHEASHLHEWSLSGGDIRVDYAAFVKKRQDYIARLHKGYTSRLEANGVALHSGFAQFVDKQTVQVGDTTLSAKHILIATGSTPMRLTFPGAEHTEVSDDFFSWTDLPERVVLVGGGYIGIELAGALRQLGVEVHLVCRKARILRAFPAFLGDAVLNALAAQGVIIHPEQELQSVSLTADGQHRLVETTKDTIANVDHVVVTAGRVPNTEGLGLASAGITLDQRGYIVVDEQQNCSEPNCYAVGDVTTAPALTPVAIKQGRLLSDRLFGNQAQATFDGRWIPTVVFSHPPMASVGLSEEAAIETHGTDSISVYEASFTPMSHAFALSPIKTRVQLVCLGKAQTVIGCHLFGHQVDEMMQGFAVAIQMGATKADFDATLAIHPTASEELVTLKRPKERT